MNRRDLIVSTFTALFTPGALDASDKQAVKKREAAIKVATQRLGEILDNYLETHKDMSFSMHKESDSVKDVLNLMVEKHLEKGYHVSVYAIGAYTHVSVTK